MNTELTALVEKQINEAPDKLIQSISYQNQTYWIKQRPFSKKNTWHSVQKILSHCIPLPILRPTVSQGGSQSLQQEARRITIFHENNIPAPELICQTPDYLLTKDCGLPLQALFNKINKEDQREPYLHKAAQSLSELHSKKLCHGRPSCKDLLLQNETLYWIDLEDDPLTVMSLAEAQARDLWLLMVDFAKYTQNKNTLETLWTGLLEKAESESLMALKKFIKAQHPFKQVLKHFPVKWVGKEIKRAILINTIYEKLRFKDHCQDQSI